MVVLHNMRREAARTLHSLSRAYQRGIADLAYEVRRRRQRIEPGPEAHRAEEVAAFGPEFRLLDMGADAPPTPIPALNAGIAAGRGRNFALMIDGAHVLTPGVLRHGMTGLARLRARGRRHRPVVRRPGPAARRGRPRATTRPSEDRLFEAIEWPVDGYRLFEIGHFIGDGAASATGSTASSSPTASSPPASALEQIGGFDEAFSMPGGGYANLDLYERLAVAPGTNVVTILGEGSFHQVHGGTTTNAPDPEAAASRARRLRPPLRGAAGPVDQGPDHADPPRRRLVGARRPAHPAPAA